MGKGEGNLKENKYIEPVDITPLPDCTIYDLHIIRRASTRDKFDCLFLLSFSNTILVRKLHVQGCNHSHWYRTSQISFLFFVLPVQKKSLSARFWFDSTSKRSERATYVSELVYVFVAWRVSLEKGYFPPYSQSNEEDWHASNYLRGDMPDTL